MACLSAGNTSSGLPLCLDPAYPSTVFTDILGGGIDSVLAVDQIGRANGKFFLHSTDHTSEANLLVLSQPSASGVLAQASGTDTGTELPPTPATSFVSALPSLAASTLVLSGYDLHFGDPAYHSRFDSNDTRALLLSDVVRWACCMCICVLCVVLCVLCVLCSALSELMFVCASVAQLTADSVYALCGGSGSEAVPAVDPAWTRQVLDCLLHDWACDLFASYVSFE